MDRLDTLRERLRLFVAEREWEQFHDPKNLAMAIASETGELVAEMRWVASEDADDFVRDERNRQRIENEIGDVAIALLLFCERAKIDVLSAVEQKLELNAANYPVERSKGRSRRPPSQA